MEPASSPGGEYVQSLARGLMVIRAFNESHPEMTLSEVARETGMSRAAARRFLHTLVHLGYVWTDGRVFALTPRVLELGFAYLSSVSLPEIAQPYLERLVSEVHESASVSVLDGTDIVYVARVPTSRIMTVSINIGTRFPAYATSMGKVLLAHMSPEELQRYLQRVRLRPLGPHTTTKPEELQQELAAIREQGWALVDQELEVGLRSIAAPIRDRTGKVVAAANISTHASRTSPEEARGKLLPHLLETVARIEAELRVTPNPRTGALSQ
ncbi:IclR family transcriptional regulator [Saccharopolyspora rectivirgula]|jgi:IclR family pca regulon transcriptional regulator|uniref:Glycerol operon regulatory protein n=1 Tax=Saccharopolyspora rectivirgula TaxID=28042 RepID=A0A073AX41_9PSEU|nr:IclR family transcriptional regulator [Saccharopolyspora rectivirgula]KEI43970.1 IclR family transcriptional regulator [Saccharopolyspora rectivirgula]